jgi:hypothetical protein
MPQFTKPLAQTLPDPTVEAWRKNADQRIAELQAALMLGAVFVGEFTIADGEQKIINHRLGRTPTQVILSPPRVEFGTPGFVAGGTIADISGGGLDRTQSVRILAAGHGVPVTVTVTVL